MTTRASVTDVAQQFEQCNATKTVVSSDGRLHGIFVSVASSSPTLKVNDSNGIIANTFTPIAGQFYPLPTTFRGSLVVTIGGTVDCTVFWTKGAV